MHLAEISTASAFLSTVIGLACGATLIAFVFGIALTVRRSSRRIGKRVLVIALLSVPVALALLIVLALLDASASDTVRAPNKRAPGNGGIALPVSIQHP